MHDPNCFEKGKTYISQSLFKNKDEEFQKKAKSTPKLKDISKDLFESQEYKSSKPFTYKLTEYKSLKSPQSHKLQKSQKSLQELKRQYESSEEKDYKQLVNS